MPIKGLNATCTIQRRIQGSDDVVGGAVISFVDVYTKVRCRIDSVRPTFFVTPDQGIESQKMFQVIIWPANYTIYEGDRLLITAPAAHEFFGVAFQIDSVMIDSVAPSDDRRHIELYVSRFERSRAVA